jgi:hypothetical protein
MHSEIVEQRPLFDLISSRKVAEPFGLDRSSGSGFFSIPVIPDQKDLGSKNSKVSAIARERQEKIQGLHLAAKPLVIREKITL